MSAAARDGYYRGMQFRLTLRKSGNALVYGIPAWYRAVLSAIAAVLAAASFAAGGVSVIGIAAAALTLLGALYEERWSFDAATGACEGRMGLVFAARGPSFQASAVERLRLDVFIKGRLDQAPQSPDAKLPPGSQIRLFVDLAGGESLLVDSVPVRSRAGLERVAKAIAAALGVLAEGCSD